MACSQLTESSFLWWSSIQVGYTYLRSTCLNFSERACHLAIAWVATIISVRLAYYSCRPYIYYYYYVNALSGTRYRKCWKGELMKTRRRPNNLFDIVVRQFQHTFRRLRTLVLYVPRGFVDKLLKSMCLLFMFQHERSLVLCHGGGWSLDDWSLGDRTRPKAVRGVVGAGRGRPLPRRGSGVTPPGHFWNTTLPLVTFNAF